MTSWHFWFIICQFLGNGIISDTLESTKINYKLYELWLKLTLNHWQIEFL